MNPDLPRTPREELEARLTALLLGELPAGEAAAVRRALAQDAELRKLHDRLQATMALVREAVAGQTAPADELTPLRLSEERRQKLLAHFKTVPLPARPGAPRRGINWLVAAAAVIAGLCLLSAALLPSFVRAKNRSASNVMLNNLRMIEAAKEQWALEHHKSDTDAVTLDDLKPYFKNGRLPQSVRGEKYVVSKVGEPVALEAERGGRVNPSLSTRVPRELLLDRADRQARPPAAAAASAAQTRGSAGQTTPQGAQPGEPAAGELLARRTSTIVLPRVDTPVEAARAPDPVTAGGAAHGGFAGRALAPQTGANRGDTLTLHFGSGQAGESRKAPVLGDLPTLGQTFSASSGGGGAAAGGAAPAVAAPPTRLADADGRSESGGLAGAVLSETAKSEAVELVPFQPKLPAPTLKGTPEDLPQGPNIEPLGSRPEGTVILGRPEAARSKTAMANALERTRAAQWAAERGSKKKAAGVELESAGRAASPVEKPLDSGGARQDAELHKAEATRLAEGGQDARLGRALRTEERARVAVASLVEVADDAKPTVRQPATNAPVPQPEVRTADNPFSTFSLNVSDVAFQLAAASLEQGQMPDAASVRAEEFINAFDYRDPEPPPGVPVAFAWERARWPFAHNRDLLRFSLKTAAMGRQAGRPLNLVLLLDNSGSMERADRVRIIREALRVLAGQLQPRDKLSVVTFARTARLRVDGVAGDKAGALLEQVAGFTPEGGTNLEEAMNLAYATALRHYIPGGVNRVVLLTDGAANLGDVEPESLRQKVEAHRRQGIALDCFGIGWEGFNDDLLEVLSRHGDGRYGFVNTPEEAATEFAGRLAGALRVAASDVKVQVEFNPRRVTAYRQIGYAKHQLTREQFRDNAVDAAEIAAQEAGNALYVIEVNPRGEGPLGIVRCRFRIPGTDDYRELEWVVPYTGNAVSLEQAGPALRLAACAAAFAEWLVVSPFAAEVTPEALLDYLREVPEVFGADPRPRKLEWMIRQAQSIGGK